MKKEKVVEINDYTAQEEQIETGEVANQGAEPNVTGEPKKKWSLKKKLLVIGGAVLGVLGVTALAITNKSKDEPFNDEQSYSDDTVSEPATIEGEATDGDTTDSQVTWTEY
mgnify:CR=1 FL=1